MDDIETIPYLDRLLVLYEEKLKRFRLYLTILLAGTIIFFFLIFLPYITLIGNQESCRVNELDCPALYQSGLEERVSDVSTSWGNVPVSTAEVAVFFPTGVACGIVAVSSQLQGLMRLRQAITQQVNNLEEPMDVTLIAPLLIDPKQNIVDQIVGSSILLFPCFIVLFSINLIILRIDALKNSMPYIQDVLFYYRLYWLSALLVIYSLVKIGWNIFQAQAFERR